MRPGCSRSAARLIETRTLRENLQIFSSSYSILNSPFGSATTPSDFNFAPSRKITAFLLAPGSCSMVTFHLDPGGMTTTTEPSFASLISQVLSSSITRQTPMFFFLMTLFFPEREAAFDKSSPGAAMSWATGSSSPGAGISDGIPRHELMLPDIAPDK